MDKEEYTACIVSRLSPLGEITTKKMFGANAFYVEGILFGMVMKSGEFYLKANEQNIARFKDNDCQQFNPRNTKKGMPYWKVPDKVIDNNDSLIQWSKEALQALKK